MNGPKNESPMTERAAMRQLVERLKAQRLARNWSQREFAFRAGLSRATIANLEAGYANLSLLNLVRILSILGLLNNLPKIIPEDEGLSTWESTEKRLHKRKRAGKKRSPPWERRG